MRVPVLSFLLAVSLLALPLAGARDAAAATVVYTDRTAFNQATQGEVPFPFTASNVLAADEVTVLPQELSPLGTTLTFQAGAAGGLPVGFVFQTLEPGSVIEFRQSIAGVPGAGNTPALSIGNINTHRNDDFRVTFLGGLGVRAFGLELLDNEGFPDTLTFFGPGNQIVATVVITSSNAIAISGSGVTLGNPLPTTIQPFKSAFFGVVTTDVIVKIEHDDDAFDNLFTANFVFADPVPATAPGAAVPEPTSLALLGLGAGVAALGRLRRRRAG